MQIRRDESQCNSCMLCVRSCIYGVWRNNNGIPSVDHIESCNLCSHCIAVCPNDAIFHEGLDSTEISKIGNKNLNPAVYREIVRSRRSIRHFKDKTVPNNIIKDVIDLARYAPTASNDQNVEYIIITDKKIINKVGMEVFGYASRFYNRSKKGILKLIIRITGLADNRYFKRIDFAQKQYIESGRDPILYGAPVLILIHSPSNSRFGKENCAIAATTIINYVHSMGLGTCFAGYLTIALKYRKKLRNQLGILKNRKIHECLVLGWPSYSYEKTVSRKKPVIKWL